MFACVVQTIVMCCALLAADEIVRAAPGAGGLTIGLEAGASTMLGDAGNGVPLGFTTSPYIGYEIAYGLTPAIAVSYSQWDTGARKRWELSALPGLRWNILQGRVRPWIETAAGYGQLIHSSKNDGSVDIGVRLQEAAGLNVLVSPRVLAGAHLSFNRLVADGPSSSWLDLGVGASVALF